MNTDNGLNAFSSYPDRAPKLPESAKGKLLRVRSIRFKRLAKKAYKHRHKGVHHISQPNVEKQTQYDLE